MTAVSELQAIVLAGSRASGDPVAQHAGVSHKALVPVAGTPMIGRVVAALRESGLVTRIAVVIEDAALLGAVPGLGELIDDGIVLPVDSAATPSLSAAKAVAALGARYPVLLTTADHALLTADMVREFVVQAAADGADVVAALADRQTIVNAYPDTRRTYLRFRDGLYSGCNLFFLATPASDNALAFWRRVEENRKSPWRIAGAVGVGTAVLYVLGALRRDQALARLSRAMGATGKTTVLPFAEAAIDVDKPEDLRLVERIVAERSA